MTITGLLLMLAGFLIIAVAFHALRNVKVRPLNDMAGHPLPLRYQTGPGFWLRYWRTPDEEWFFAWEDNPEGTMGPYNVYETMIYDAESIAAACVPERN